MGSTVVVLGGGGFVGRAVCDRLAAAGHRVVAAGRSAPGPGSVRLDLVADDVAHLAGVLAGVAPDVVVNSVGSIWGRTDAQMWEATTLPVLRLLDVLDSLPVRPRLVHLGTVLEYGPTPEDTPVGPDVPDVPDTAYGAAKLAATRAVLDRVRSDGLDARILRVANVLGRGTPDVSLLGRVAGALLTAGPGGPPVEIELTPLLARRDYVHVDDVAGAVLRAVTAPGAGDVLPIGRGRAVPVRELVELLIEISGRQARIRESGPAGPAEHLCVDPRPAARVLGWTPRRSLREAARDLWEQRSARAAFDPASTGGVEPRRHIEHPMEVSP
ncbi:MAG: NAD(P)-dependent oxidoreductase [Pseudonocardia sp.]|nr:NAD(P)-dependent oxidoreductase [Pseudonocardia sp.]